jgi:hypothetical protein
MGDLRDFEARAGTKGSVAYVRNRGNVADIIDYGKKIFVSSEYDEKTILAALQLVQQKWGGVNISGDERFKKICLDIALRKGIRIFTEGKEAARKVETPDAKSAEPAAGVFVPQIGDRVAFHVENKNTGKKISLVGVIVSMDDVKGTVTMRVGQNKYTVNRNKGYFTAAKEPLERAAEKTEPEKDRSMGR